ncbi:hypothetical protein [Salinibacterium sp. PAMC 21357]|uniref:hypothetical protein n=1 Tax=Salinibacterium sp. PAMC 21357 TaxID=1112215 RepID=UPI0002897049|nr:hypothetical protein [Salinibacterium sp. PAMC 21357]
MTSRQRIVLLSAISAAALIVVIVFGTLAYLRSQTALTAPSSVAVIPVTEFAGDRIEFRNTAAGADYGKVASVPLDDASGIRSLSSQLCDRVYSTSTLTMCLTTDAGILTTWTALQIDDTGAHAQSWSLPGVPSRTRISANSHLVAETSFVTGISYAGVGFATETIIATSSGESYGNIENFTLLVDGEQVTAADRNIWGVTFADDDRHFYATAASAGSTWLVYGDLVDKTLTSVRGNAECPSLSPDRSRVAFKKNIGTLNSPDWRIAVLDLTTMAETVLAEERSVDDQVEWLDDATVLYGLPRPDVVGDSDVWSLPADGSGAPLLFIPHAWSPSVVRP